VSNNHPDNDCHRLLHAYELGLLDDDGRREFELHLMDCQVCFEKVQKMQAAIDIIADDPDSHERLRQIDDEKIGTGATERSPSTDVHRPLSRRLLPLSLAATLVLIFLILQPWQLKFTGTDEATASENRLAIVPFANLSDPSDSDRLGEIISNLLITDLTESHYVQVMSWQRLYDLFRILGKPYGGELDVETSLQVATEGNARWLLTGSIIEVDPKLVLVTQLIDVTSGDVVASRRIEGVDGETIFSVVDRLTAEVKKELALPSEALREQDPVIANVTTHSLRAYTAYVEGLRLRDKFFFAEAAEKFETAIKNDSTFAMAYFELSYIRTGPEQEGLINRAASLSTNLIQKERLWVDSRKAQIKGDGAGFVSGMNQILERWPDEKEALRYLGEHYYSLRQMEEAIALFKRVIELDPFHKLTYNDLAYTYSYRGDYDSALWALDRYSALAPEEPNPHDSRGDIQRNLGRLAEAKESYRTAIQIRPDFNDYGTVFKLCELLLIEYDYDEIARQLTLAAAPSTHASRSIKSFLGVLQAANKGQFRLALRLIDESIAQDLEQEHHIGAEYKFRYRGIVNRELGNIDQAVEDLRLSIRYRGEAYPLEAARNRHFLVQMLAESGRLEEAEKVASELRRDLDSSQSPLWPYWYAVGSMEMSRGNFDSAIVLFEQPPGSDIFFYPYMLAQANLEAEHLERAIDLAQGLLGDYSTGRVHFNPWGINLYYYLGIAYEQVGQHDAATEQLTLYLDIMRDADPGLHSVAEAQVRLARLKNRP
jgi:tetratricopeptide (TPR) repeat protein